MTLTDSDVCTGNEFLLLQAQRQRERERAREVYKMFLWKFIINILLVYFFPHILNSKLLQSCQDITKQPLMAIWIFWKKPREKIWTLRMKMAWHQPSGQLIMDTSRLFSSYAVEGELTKTLLNVHIMTELVPTVD